MIPSRFKQSPLVAFGYAAPFDSWSAPITHEDGQPFVERFEPGAFADVLASLRRHPVEARISHEQRIATTADGSLWLTADRFGLLAYIDLSGGATIQRHAAEQLQAGHMRHFSPCFQGKSTRWTADGYLHRSVYRVTELTEVSLCSVPCYRETAARLFTRSRRSSLCRS